MMQRVDAETARRRITGLLSEQERNRAWLARRMGFAYMSVWRVLAGHEGMSLNFARRAAGALGLPEGEFVKDAQEEVA